jgi:hypothetical protein
MKGDEPASEEMPQWVRIGEEVPELRDAPFRLYFRAFSSSSAAANAFIRDPRGSLSGQTGEGFEDVEPAPIEGVGPETRISTFVINHHRTLARRIIYTTATVADDDDVVGVTIYKLEA